MARKELIPPEKWEGLKAALEEASGTKKSTSGKKAPKPVDEKKKEKKYKKEKKGKKDKKDKGGKGKKGKKKGGKKKNARK